MGYSAYDFDWFSSISLDHLSFRISLSHSSRNLLSAIRSTRLVSDLSSRLLVTFFLAASFSDSYRPVQFLAFPFLVIADVSSRLARQYTLASRD